MPRFYGPLEDGNSAPMNDWPPAVLDCLKEILEDMDYFQKFEYFGDMYTTLEKAEERVKSDEGLERKLRIFYFLMEIQQSARDYFVNMQGDPKYCVDANQAIELASLLLAHPLGMKERFPDLYAEQVVPACGRPTLQQRERSMLMNEVLSPFLKAHSKSFLVEERLFYFYEDVLAFIYENTNHLTVEKDVIAALLKAIAK